MFQIGRKLGKWHWRHNLSTWRHCPIFLTRLVSLVKFSYWSKFHVNINGVMTISFYNGLTRNSEIGNTPVWVLRNIWGLGRVRNTKFGKNVFNKVLLNAAKCQDYRFYRFWVIKGKPTGGYERSLSKIHDGVF